MVKIKVVYTDDAQVEALKLIEGDDVSVSFINDKKEELKARRFKHHWGAIKSPFALVEIDDKPTRGFYSEKYENVIDEVIKFVECQRT